MKNTTLLTVKEASEILKIGTSSLYSLLSKGELQHYKFGGAIRISEEQIEAYLTSCVVERGEERAAKASPPLKHLNPPSPS